MKVELGVEEAMLEEFCRVIETGIEVLADVDPDLATGLLDWVEGARTFLGAQG